MIISIMCFSRKGSKIDNILNVCFSRKGLAGPDSPENEDAYPIGDSPR